VADTALVARRLGVIDPPETVAALAEQLDGFRAELQSTTEARAAARLLLLNPPLPWLARPPYLLLGSAAVGLLPGYARRPLRLPHLPVLEHTVVRLAGHFMTGSIRWALQPPPVDRPTN
jgi:uncharacterized protein (DUF2236 family)